MRCHQGLLRDAIAYLRSFPSRHAVVLRNSAAISVGTVSSAVLGFAYWWVAARWFAPEAMGRASALLSLMGLIGLIGDAGLGTLMTGEASQARREGLISAAALVALCLSLSVGCIVLELLRLDSKPGHGMTSSGISGLLLVAGCGLTGLCFVVDQAFVGMLMSTVRMLRQVFFSTGKLALLPAIAVWSSSEAAILFTWVSAGIVSLGACELLLRRYKKRSLLHLPDFSALRRLRRKAAHHYLLDLAIQAPGMIMPYMVATLLTPATNAAFTVMWMIVSMASVIPASLATVLFPSITSEPARHQERMLISIILSTGFSLAMGIIINLFSHDILRTINTTYADIGGHSLRWLGFGLVGATLKFHLCTEARLRNSMYSASFWFFGGAIFELGCCISGARLGGLAGLSVGWAAGVLSESLMILVLLFTVGGWRLSGAQALEP